MRLLVSEFVCGGGWPNEALESSLVTEGRAMLLAVLRDAVCVPDLEVMTIWSASRERFPVEGVAFQLAHSPDEELEILGELAAWCDATLLIAPEFDGILTQRALLVEGVGGRLFGCNPIGITHCTDKLQLARHLAEAGLPTIPTHDFSAVDTPASELTFPAVIKPRDGAGSQDTYLVQSATDFDRLRPVWKNSSLLRQAIWQSYIPGRAVSVAVLVIPEQYHYEALPPCEQTLSTDGLFQYLGGVIPARDVTAAAIQATAVAACRSVPGLRGYVGIDLILPDADPTQPVIVEINPRITTSYLGYSKLCEQNLIARCLNSDLLPTALTWGTRQLFYTRDGIISSI